MGYLDTIRKVKKELAEQDATPADDPLLLPEHWYPEFHRLHAQVIAETSDFDYGWLRRNRPDLYRQIKNKENEIDALETARLSEVIAIMREWRALIVEAEFKRGRLKTITGATSRPMSGGSN